MKLTFILFFLFALLCACAPQNRPLASSPQEKKATAEDNLKVIKQVAAQQKVQLAPNKRYALYEKWPPKGHGAYECVTGWSHVRLIVGTYKEDDCDDDFSNGMSFDLGRTGGDKKGGEVTINEREWRANHILVGGGDAAYWHKASAESTYDWAGEVKDDMATIKRKGMIPLVQSLMPLLTLNSHAIWKGPRDIQPNHQQLLELCERVVQANPLIRARNTARASKEAIRKTNVESGKNMHLSRAMKNLMRIECCTY